MARTVSRKRVARTMGSAAPKNGRRKRLVAEGARDLDAPLTEYISMRGREAKAAILQLQRANIGLQKAFDRCFAHEGLTAQEAAVLVHCVEVDKLSAGKLAKAMGRDKGRITRLVDSLQAGGFVHRTTDPRDHRLFIRPTARAQRIVPGLKHIFEQVREEFVVGIESDDLNRLESVLAQLHANADRLYDQKNRKRCLSRPR